ncbi:N-acetyl-anhydromuranmyl-L-alanine amidase [Psychromonas marina]|uniref:1,6-anhydro-N-acetylmuramyl-L-alanine amidase AmpD n=1 Tax=Psychromonas marina TaxID=88364 RepID=A0ABQ6DW65_9GAMM|nr:1,6-anhydro-N-acetylmuramyl-L-alanine amidase AmpD [Psychromonas marina]GLS89374.1 N-acetyl-anhydromuranmyl-L-alanine amidase [Psychromonas marina]
MINSIGIYKDAEQKCSPYFNHRPEGVQISLLVIHCISLPEGVYGGKQVEQLFTGCLDCNEHETFADLNGLEVSAHCVIRRDGHVEQYVPFVKRAWHAGVSRFNNVEACNDYSIGIELEGTDKSEYTQAQYMALAKLTDYLIYHYPQLTKQRITGHSDIAPGRKNDPGECFDWQHYFSLLD